jgi:cellulose biosynthesis protein BcsQ
MSAPVAAAILAADILLMPTLLNETTYERTYPEILGLLAAHNHSPEMMWFATLVRRKTQYSEDVERQIAQDGRELLVRVPLGVAAEEARRKQISVVAYDKNSAVSKAYIALAKLVYARLQRVNGAAAGPRGRSMPDLPVMP